MSARQTSQGPGAAADLPAGLPARAAIGLVRCYQRFISGLKPPTCRFYPSCSEYVVQAISHRGFLRGGVLGVWRLLRCNPFSAGGYDPGPWSADRPHQGPT